MGGGSSVESAGPSSSAHAAIPTFSIDDEQVKNVATSSAVVAERVKNLLKTPFNSNREVTPEIVAMVSDSWDAISGKKDPLPLFASYKVENPGTTETQYLWFVKK